MELVKEIDQVTSTFPVFERFGLGQQMRRAAVSVSSNIAEGAARRSTKEFIHFLYVAQGSLSELDTQLRIAEMLDYNIPIPVLEEKITSIRKMISGLLRSLQP